MNVDMDGLWDDGVYVLVKGPPTPPTLVQDPQTERDMAALFVVMLCVFVVVLHLCKVCFGSL